MAITYIVGLLILSLCADHCSCLSVKEALEDYDNEFGYVDVRPDAHMFWWLFHTTHAEGYRNRPWVLWIQGGPGNSGTGMGVFETLGPVDVHLKPRSTSWVKEVNLLVVDNPVGSGYSYVDNDDAHVSDLSAISRDLVSFLKVFLEKHPELQELPMYVFGQSYGGKMAVGLANALQMAVSDGEVRCDLRAIALGNSWISPYHIPKGYGEMLHAMSFIDDVTLAKMNKIVEAMNLTNLDYQSIAKLSDIAYHNTYVHPYDITLYSESYYSYEALGKLMTGPVKEYLDIPEHVEWGGQRGGIFSRQTDLMEVVHPMIDELLETTDLQVIVYQGQLDFICCTAGVMKWVADLHWEGMKDYHGAERKALLDPDSAVEKPEMFVKAHDKFKFYWVLESGHSVPRDAGAAALRMLSRIINDEDK